MLLDSIATIANPIRNMSFREMRRIVDEESEHRFANLLLEKDVTDIFYSGNAVSRATVEDPVTCLIMNKGVQAQHEYGSTYIKYKADVGTPGKKPLHDHDRSDAFLAICHYDLEYDIRRLPDFLKVMAYRDSTKRFHPMEIGRLMGVRFIMNKYLKPFIGAGRNAADVYPIFILGQIGNTIFDRPDMDFRTRERIKFEQLRVVRLEVGATKR